MEGRGIFVELLRRELEGGLPCRSSHMTSLPNFKAVRCLCVYGSVDEDEGASVLVGVDDSEASRDAAALGFRVARAAESPMHLVTATLDALAEVTAARVGLDPCPLEKALERQAALMVRARLRGRRRTKRSIVHSPPAPEDPSACWSMRRRAPSIRSGRIRGQEPARPLALVPPRYGAPPAGRLDLPLFVSGPRSARIARVLVAVDLSSSRRQSRSPPPRRSRASWRRR